MINELIWPGEQQIWQVNCPSVLSGRRAKRTYLPSHGPVAVTQRQTISSKPQSCNWSVWVVFGSRSSGSGFKFSDLSPLHSRYLSARYSPCPSLLDYSPHQDSSLRLLLIVQIRSETVFPDRSLCRHAHICLTTHFFTSVIQLLPT